MARYTGPVCRLCRTEGDKLFLKGDRCFTTKCSFERRNYGPGIHGKAKSIRPRLTEYATQLRMKQRVRRAYGLQEKQFRTLYENAKKRGVTGLALLQMLESRLDNLVFRMGLASSRTQARMLVTHGHILVDGKRVNIPSYQVKVGSEIQIREKSALRARCKEMQQVSGSRGLAEWVKIDPDNVKGTFIDLPTREQLDPKIQENLIVEFYSR